MRLLSKIEVTQRRVGPLPGPAEEQVMDQLAIQTIENFLSVPLIAPERIHELDAKELASALGRLDDEATCASEEIPSDAWEKPLDEINEERLDQITTEIS